MVSSFGLFVVVQKWSLLTRLFWVSLILGSPDAGSPCGSVLTDLFALLGHKSLYFLARGSVKGLYLDGNCVCIGSVFLPQWVRINTYIPCIKGTKTMELSPVKGLQTF